MSQPDIDFELYVANYYRNKVNNCKSRGIEFNLSLQSVRNLLSAKKCPYTGVALTRPRDGISLPTDITIDRIDNRKGYVKGNVQAISYAANNFKSYIENPQRNITPMQAIKVLQRVDKVRKEGSE